MIKPRAYNKADYWNDIPHEEKVKILLIDDFVQWNRFQNRLREKRIVTNYAVVAELRIFIIMREQEERAKLNPFCTINEKNKSSHLNLKSPSSNNLRDNFRWKINKPAPDARNDSLDKHSVLLCKRDSYE